MELSVIAGSNFVLGYGRIPRLDSAGSPASGSESHSGNGDAHGGNTGPALSDHIGDGRTAGGFHGLHNFHAKLSLASAKAEGEQLLCFTKQPVQSGTAAICEIHQADGVTDARLVEGGPVPPITWS